MIIEHRKIDLKRFCICGSDVLPHSRFGDGWMCRAQIKKLLIEYPEKEQEK